MKGTEKQVKWAESIKARVMQDINPELAKLEQRVAANPVELAKVAKIREALDNMDAAWWIDNRPDLGYKGPMFYIKAAFALVK